MAQINFKQLEAFLHVADLGSFRRAADKLNTTQPNISARIAALEAQLDCSLMKRDAGSVRLTPIGLALLPKAREVVQARDAFLVTAGGGHLFEGVLRLGVTEMVVHSWLGSYLLALKDRFPAIDVDLTVDLSANLSTGLMNRSVDLALQSGPFDRRMTGMAALGSFPFVWVASPALEIHGTNLSPADLAAHPILTHARGTVPFDQVSDHLNSGAHRRIRLVPSTNMAACLQMTVEGLGIACLPEVMVRTDIAAGRLMALRYAWHPDALCFAARYDADTAPHFVAEAASLAANVSARALPKDNAD